MSRSIKQLIEDGYDGLLPADYQAEIADLQKKQDALYEVIQRLIAFTLNIAGNFDCDEDAHRYGTCCRKCNAQELLTETQKHLKEISDAN